MPDDSAWRVVVWRGASREPWRSFAGANLDEILAGASDDTIPSTSSWSRWEAFSDDELALLSHAVGQLPQGETRSRTINARWST